MACGLLCPVLLNSHPLVLFNSRDRGAMYFNMSGVAISPVVLDHFPLHLPHLEVVVGH